MNEITYEHEGNSTVSPLWTGVGMGVSALVLLAGAHNLETRGVAAQEIRPALQRNYSSKDEMPTFDTYASMMGEYTLAVGLKQVVGDVYATLLAKQEPLGAVFEKVLYENLWDLYES